LIDNPVFMVKKRKESDSPQRRGEGGKFKKMEILKTRVNTTMVTVKSHKSGRRREEYSFQWGKNGAKKKKRERPAGRAELTKEKKKR